MDRQDDFDNTEDFTELIDDDEDMHTITETLELPKARNKYPEFRREDFQQSEYTMNTDFINLVKKRDYKGFHSEIEDEIEKTQRLNRIETIDDEDKDEPEKKPKGRRKLRKWAYLVILLLLIGGGLITYKIINDKRIAREKEEAEKALLAEINSHYNQFIKISKDTKIFEKDDKLNLSIKDINGSILLISQFTLYANTLNGNRPSFEESMKFNDAKKMYETFIDELSKTNINFKTGFFGEDMKISSINDGPVTIIIDTKGVKNEK